MKLVFTTGTCKHRFWHKTELMLDNGFTKYYECTGCRTRIITQPDTGHQPIDFSWLYSGGIPEKKIRSN